MLSCPRGGEAQLSPQPGPQRQASGMARPWMGKNPATSPGRHSSPLAFPTRLFQTPGSAPLAQSPLPSPQIRSSLGGAVSGSPGLEAGAGSWAGLSWAWAPGAAPVSNSCLHGPGPGQRSQEGQGAWNPWHLEGAQAWPPGPEVVSLYAPQPWTPPWIPPHEPAPGPPPLPSVGPSMALVGFCPCAHTHTHARAHTHQDARTPAKPRAPPLVALPGADLGRGGSAGGHAPSCRPLLSTVVRREPGPP